MQLSIKNKMLQILRIYYSNISRYLNFMHQIINKIKYKISIKTIYQLYINGKRNKIKSLKVLVIKFKILFVINIQIIKIKTQILIVIILDNK
jgi:hypothetical protein